MRYKIEFEVELPDIEHTDDELSEYLRYTYGEIASMAIDNPFNLANTDSEPIFGTFNIERA